MSTLLLRWWESTIVKVGLSSQLVASLDAKAQAVVEDAQVALLLVEYRF